MTGLYKLKSLRRCIDQSENLRLQTFNFLLKNVWLTEDMKTKKWNFLTFSEAKSISSSPYAILTSKVRDNNYRSYHQRNISTTGVARINFPRETCRHIRITHLRDLTTPCPIYTVLPSKYSFVYIGLFSKNKWTLSFRAKHTHEFSGTHGVCPKAKHLGAKQSRGRGLGRVTWHLAVSWWPLTAVVCCPMRSLDAFIMFYMGSSKYRIPRMIASPPPIDVNKDKTHHRKENTVKSRL